jgi:hypothetical protein
MTLLFSGALEVIVLFFVPALWIKAFAVIALVFIIVTIREDRR